MTKTPILTGAEVCVENLGGQNVAVQNLSEDTIWASAFPNVTAGADDVYEIPAGGGVVVLDARGTVYLLGTGKVQCTGTDYGYVNFKQPSSSVSGGGGTSGVTKSYVDARDSANLNTAKSYADTKASALDTRVTAAETAISVLNGTGVGSVSKTVSDGIAEVVAGAPESLNTLKEISDWIDTHEDSAAAMNSAIQDNKSDIASLQTAKADKSDIPTTLPANGGNADTVNGHAVNADVPADAKFTDTTYSAATPSSDGLESREDKSKLDGIEAGAQVNTVTGVKGGAESGYRTGNVSLTAANVGAAESVHSHSATDITSGVLPIARGGTGNATGRVTAGAAAGITLGESATAEGIGTIASTISAHAEGRYCAATGYAAHAQGYAALAKGTNSAAFGGGTVAWNPNQLVIGMHNKIVTVGSPFVIGWGEAAVDNIPADFIPTDGEAYSNCVREGNTPKNIFRVALTGAVYGVGAFNTSGADYAEYIKPWFDGNADNEDRRGYFVTVKGSKLHKAEPEDYIVGITSGNPSVIGNGDEDWLGRWQRDEFNELVYRDVEVDDYEEREDENGNLTAVKVGSHIEKHTVQNPDYDPEQEYVERKDRPEWSCVGMIGVLPLRDDGTCIAGGFAKCGAGGIATAADEWDCHKTFFVIERINDHVISVEMR